MSVLFLQLVAVPVQFPDCSRSPLLFAYVTNQIDTSFTVSKKFALKDCSPDFPDHSPTVFGDRRQKSPNHR